MSWKDDAYIFDAHLSKIRKAKAASSEHSHGFERLSDLEVAQWVHEDDGQKIDWLLKEMGELAKRGMKIKECTECGSEEVVYDHDYICILCRANV